jgi:hypothetical protein
MDAEVVLKRFKTTTPEQDEASKLGQYGDGDSWIQLRIFSNAAVADKAKAEAKRLSQNIHSLQVNNALLYNENTGLQQALNTKKKHKTKRTTLGLQHRDEYYGGAVFWSPRKLREATKQDEAEQLQL